MSMVDEGQILREESVAVEGEDVVRCLPACTRRREVGGREVRRERSWQRVVMVVEEGIERGMTG